MLLYPSLHLFSDGGIHVSVGWCQGRGDAMIYAGFLLFWFNKQWCGWLLLLKNNVCSLGNENLNLAKIRSGGKLEN